MLSSGHESGEGSHGSRILMPRTAPGPGRAGHNQAHASEPDGRDRHLSWAGLSAHGTESPLTAVSQDWPRLKDVELCLDPSVLVGSGGSLTSWLYGQTRGVERSSKAFMSLPLGAS